jgi:hypothetical protein
MSSMHSGNLFIIIIPYLNLQYKQLEVTLVNIEGDAILCVGNPVLLRLLVLLNRLVTCSLVFAEMLIGLKPIELDLLDDLDILYLIYKSIYRLRLT